MEIFIPIIAAGFGGILALAGVAISNWSNLKVIETKLNNEKIEKDRDDKIARGEELYALFSEWSTFIVSSDISLFSVMRGELTYNQHLDLYIESGGKHDLKPHRMELLIHAYFPSLIKEYYGVQKTNRVRKSIKDEHRRSYSPDTKGTDYLDSFGECFYIFKDRTEGLKKSIIAELSKLSRR